MKTLKQSLVDIADILNLDVPTNLRMDQKLFDNLAYSIKTVLTTYDPTAPSTGDALVSDVRAGKTFSNTAAVGLTGTMTFTAIPTPTLNVLAGMLKLHIEAAPMYEAMFESIDIYQGETLLGQATKAEGSWTYNLSTVIASGGAGAYSLAVKYVAKSTVTLSDSAAAAAEFDAYSITRTLTGCADSNAGTLFIGTASLSGTLSLLEGFNTLPATITITAGEATLVQDTDYTYDNTSGAYVINGAATTGNIGIVAIATA